MTVFKHGPAGAFSGIFKHRALQDTIPLGYFENVRSVLGASNIVAHWRHDDETGLVSTDVSGNGNDGTIDGGVSLGATTLLAQNGGKSFDFDGVDGHIDCGPKSLTNFIHQTGIFSVGAWVDFTDAGDTQVIFSTAGLVSGTGLVLSIPQVFGTPRLTAIFRGGANTSIRAGASTPADGIHYVLVTADGTTMSLYLDGVLIASDTITTTTGDSGATPEIAGAGASYWDGRIDEVTLASVHADSADAVALYDFGTTPAPVVDLKADTNITTSGTTVTAWSSDVGTLALDTIVGSPDQSAGGGLELNGTNQYAHFTGTASNFEPITATGVFSFGVRVRVDNIATTSTAIFHTQSTARGVFLGWFGNNNFRFTAANGAGGTLWSNQVSLSGLGYVNGDDIEVIVLGDGVNSYMYIDGVLESTESITTQSGAHFNGGTLGRLANSGNGYFNGAINALFFEPTVRPVTTIQAAMV